MTDGNTSESEKEDLFSYTRSSALNSLIEEAKNIYEDDFDPDFFIDDFRDKLQKYRELLEKLKEFYVNLKEIQEDAPVIMEQSKIVAKNFDLIFQGIREMEEYFEYREKDKIIRGLKVVKEANQAIFDAVDIINQEEDRLEKYSRSPYVHELIRVASGVLSKGFPRDALKEKLEDMINHTESVYRDFQIYKTARFETVAIQKRISDMNSSLEKFREGLHEMEQYFSDDDPAHVERGIQLIKEGSDVLIECYELIQNELKTSSSKYCVKCGEENSLPAKFCHKCSALLPEIQRVDEDSKVDVKVDGGEDRVLTSNIIRLTDAVNDFCEGRSSEEELLKIIEWMEVKVQAGVNALQNMAPLEIVESEEEKENLIRVGELLEQGTYELESALAMMKRFFEDGEVANLKEGLASAHEAGYKLYQVQERCKFAGDGR